MVKKQGGVASVMRRPPVGMRKEKVMVREITKEAAGGNTCLIHNPGGTDTWTERWWWSRPQRMCANRLPHEAHVFGVIRPWRRSGRGGPYCCRGRWSQEELDAIRARARVMAEQFRGLAD